MAINFCSLSSGSTGNCYYLGNDFHGILTDAGFALPGLYGFPGSHVSDGKPAFIHFQVIPAASGNVAADQFAVHPDTPPAHFKDLRLGVCNLLKNLFYQIHVVLCLVIMYALAQKIMVDSLGRTSLMFLSWYFVATGHHKQYKIFSVQRYKPSPGVHAFNNNVFRVTGIINISVMK